MTSTEGEVAVRIEPLGVTIAVARGRETLMQAARRAGLRWPTVCHESGICAVCHALIVESAAPLPPPSSSEQRTLKQLPEHLQKDDVRLACQIFPAGAMVVRRAGVRRRDEPL